MHTSPFDALAPDYDTTFTTTRLGRSLREIVWSRFDRAFAGCQRILELGCGTGEDAVRLASRGIRVVATDASTVMLDAAQRKARERGCSVNVDFVALPMEEIQQLQGSVFDGTFSNFGAINCVPNLPLLARRVAALVRPGAPLIWVVMGRHVPWEWVWYLAHGEPGKAVRRLRHGGARWRGMQIAYPTPGETYAALQPYFRIARIAPLGCFLPPSYASDWLDRSPAVAAGLARLEALAQHFSALAWCADHYIVEARRTHALTR